MLQDCDCETPSINIIIHLKMELETSNARLARPIEEHKALYVQTQELTQTLKIIENGNIFLNKRLQRYENPSQDYHNNRHFLTNNYIDTHH